MIQLALFNARTKPSIKQRTPGAIVSWVNASPWNPIVQFLYNVTEPVLRPMRRALPFLQMGIDLTPWALILLIQFVVSPVARDMFFYAAGLFR